MSAKERFLRRIESTLYKVYIDDLDEFFEVCRGFDISVDNSHLDWDGCLTVDDRLGVEVIDE